jgi:hypothetical protein
MEKHGAYKGRGYGIVEAGFDCSNLTPTHTFSKLIMLASELQASGIFPESSSLENYHSIDDVKQIDDGPEPVLAATRVDRDGKRKRESMSMDLSRASPRLSYLPLLPDNTSDYFALLASGCALFSDIRIA